MVFVFLEAAGCVARWFVMLINSASLPVCAAVLGRRHVVLCVVAQEALCVSTMRVSQPVLTCVRASCVVLALCAHLACVALWATTIVVVHAAVAGPRNVSLVSACQSDHTCVGELSARSLRRAIKAFAATRESRLVLAAVAAEACSV